MKTETELKHRLDILTWLISEENDVTYLTSTTRLKIEREINYLKNTLQ